MLRILDLTFFGFSFSGLGLRTLLTLIGRQECLRRQSRGQVCKSWGGVLAGPWIFSDFSTTVFWWTSPPSNPNCSLIAPGTVGVLGAISTGRKWGPQLLLGQISWSHGPPNCSKYKFVCPKTVPGAIAIAPGTNNLSQEQLAIAPGTVGAAQLLPGQINVCISLLK